VGDSLS
jgi:hypothetical protein